MGTYILLADVHENEFQNAQELASVWGEIQSAIDDRGGELTDSYALMGGNDFLMVLDVDDPETALRIAVAVERYGVDTQTMPAFSMDRFADLVADL